MNVFLITTLTVLFGLVMECLVEDPFEIVNCHSVSLMCTPQIR